MCSKVPGHGDADYLFSMLLLQGELQNAIWDENDSKFMKRLTRDALAYNREKTKDEFPFLQVSLKIMPQELFHSLCFWSGFPLPDGLALRCPVLFCFVGSQFKSELYFFLSSAHGKNSTTTWISRGLICLNLSFPQERKSEVDFATFQPGDDEKVFLHIKH